MKNKLSSSAFNKMYLVGPAVYNKLLNCLDDLEKKQTIDLNNDKEGVEEQRPSEKLLAQLNNQPEDIQVIPESVDNGEGENQGGQDPERYGPPVVEPQAPVVQDEQVPDNVITIENNQPNNTNNPLNIPCPENVNCNKNRPITNLKPKTGYVTAKNKKITSISNQVPKGNYKSPRFKCDICGQTVARAFGLERHRLTKHSDIYPTKESAKVIKNNSTHLENNQGQDLDVEIQDAEEGGNNSAQEESTQNDKSFNQWGDPINTQGKRKRQTVIIPLISKPLKRSLDATGFTTSSKIPFKKKIFEKGMKRSSSDAKLSNKPAKKFQQWIV